MFVPKIAFSHRSSIAHKEGRLSDLVVCAAVNLFRAPVQQSTEVRKDCSAAGGLYSQLRLLWLWP